MKFKRFVAALICAFAMTLIFTTTAFAKTGTYVFDEQDLLSSAEFEELESLGAKYADQYKIGTYYLLIDTMGSDVESGSERKEYAREQYESRNLGVGSNKNGILLVVATSQRKFTIVKHFDNKAEDPFSDDGVTSMGDEAKSYLKKDDWYGAGSSYYENAGSNMEYFAKHGKQWSDGNTIGFLIKVGVTIAAPLAIAGLVVSSEKRAMRTAVMQTEANFYFEPNSFALRTSTDTFTHTTMNVTPIPKNDSSDSSGGGDSGWTDMGDGFSGYDGGDF